MAQSGDESRRECESEMVRQQLNANLLLKPFDRWLCAEGETPKACPFSRLVTGCASTYFGLMEITKAGTQASGKGPAEWFTGTVRIHPLLDAPEPAGVAGASVTFDPGARTAWHTHPLGQTLIVTAGADGATLGRGGRGDPARGRRVVPPGEKHWHGASPKTAMAHIAIQEKLDGKVVDWMEHVTDEQYGGLE